MSTIDVFQLSFCGFALPSAIPCLAGASCRSMPTRPAAQYG
jgi:hypothetical protein